MNEPAPDPDSANTPDPNSDVPLRAAVAPDEVVDALTPSVRQNLPIATREGVPVAQEAAPTMSAGQVTTIAAALGRPTLSVVLALRAARVKVEDDVLPPPDRFVALEDLPCRSCGELMLYLEYGPTSRISCAGCGNGSSSTAFATPD